MPLVRVAVIVKLVDAPTTIEAALGITESE